MECCKIPNGGRQEVAATTKNTHGTVGKKGPHFKTTQTASLGKRLLGVAMDFTMIMLGTGGFAMLEHPSAATYRISAPSIWRLPFTQIIANSPAGRLVHFRQRVHGQISEKPTTLLTVRLQTLAKYIHRPQCHIEPQPKQVLGGLTEQGTWETAAAKVYPPSMCRATKIPWIARPEFTQRNMLWTLAQIGKSFTCSTTRIWKRRGTDKII